MTEKNKKGMMARRPQSVLETVYTVISLLLSAVLVAAGIWYAVSCISIYNSGGSSPFTRQIVIGYLRTLLPISIAAIILTIAAGILSLFTNEQKSADILSLFAKKKKSQGISISNKTLLGFVEERLSSKNLSSEYSEKRESERFIRELARLITVLGSLTVGIPTLILVILPSRYSVDDPNTDIAISSVIALCATVIILAGFYALSIIFNNSYKRETEAAKKELARQKSDGVALPPCKEIVHGEGHTVLVVRIALIVLAVGLIILGITNGGMKDVLGKAVRICTECIGLG